MIPEPETRSACSICGQPVRYFHRWDHPTEKNWRGDPVHHRNAWVHDANGDTKCDPENVPEAMKGWTNHGRPNHLCNEFVESVDADNDICYRPVKEHGVCGVHLRNVLEDMARADNDRRRKEEEAMRAELIERVLEKLKEFGIEARIRDYGSDKGMVLVDPEQLIEFLESADVEMEEFA